MKKILFFALLGAMTIVSCKKDDKEDQIKDTNNLNYNLIATDTTTNDFVVELYADEALIEVGYNKLYVKVKDLNGSEVKNATVLFHPEMDMGSSKHGSPVDNPNYNSETGLYEGAVIFTMASHEKDDWTLTIEVNNGTTVLPIEIHESKQGTKYVGSYLGTDESRYIVSLVRPFNLEIGKNEITIMVHQVANMYNFVAVEGLTIEMEPRMLSMDHGSPNNAHPTEDGNGYYTGSVTYTMSGDWRIYFDIFKDGELLVEETYVDVLF